MFILNLTYCKPIAEVETYLAEHVAYLDKYYQTGKFICSGSKEPRIGGIIICRAHDRQEVEQMILEDPFSREMVANYEIIEFTPSKYELAFAPVVG